MGQEVQCRATWKKQTSVGKALLESNEIVFRGEFRLVIPFGAVKEVSAKDGTLSVVAKDGKATFALGPHAEKWVTKIRSPKSVVEKLGAKAGARVALLGLDDPGFRADLDARGCVVRSRMDDEAELVFLAAERRAHLARLPGIVRTMRRDAAVWVVRPKGRPEITEADVMRAGKEAGLVDVKVVAFSPTHTAEKFVIRLKDR